ncbi:unnamed protein product [Ceutorhynchus assimilis]|uniref:Salivary secreted peptide n=1 Tax=Ceutorhynchus assimilis TaxID=467358 RepID=A0A9N9QMB7_9CUCU|nr:unnamed protein product [Ceutorhynchus assimilis]
MLRTNIFVFVSTMLVFAKTLPALKNTNGHEIIDGNCSSTPYDDRVYYDHVDKTSWPFIIRSETVTYYGDRQIYCIQALNQKVNGTGGSANITEGGVGHNFVVVELESNRSHGLEFYVSIYAKNSSINAIKSPMAQNLSEFE